MIKKKIFISMLFFILVISGSILYYQNTKNIETKTQLPPTHTAYFAGGCFWCTEADFEKLPEIEIVFSGYMGGNKNEANYSLVAAGKTQHREIIEVHYNPKDISYEDLVHHFFKVHDPTDAGGSFYDRGFQYTSAIYYSNDSEKYIAQNILEELGNQNIFNKPIVTSIEKATEFHKAEEYHQDYYKKNKLHYNAYRKGSGRDAFINKTWNSKQKLNYNNAPEIYSGFWDTYTKPTPDVLKETLSKEAFNITQNEGTEYPFSHTYNDNKEKGIYVDILSGEPLFASIHKFDSGTGWPSFYRPISDKLITLHEDYRLGVKRIELRSTVSDNHLGHVFEDGPHPTGLRYCINGLALTFIPYDQMTEKGYEELKTLFN